MSVAIRADREGTPAHLAPRGPFDLAHAMAAARVLESEQDDATILECQAAYFTEYPRASMHAENALLNVSTFCCCCAVAWL